MAKNPLGKSREVENPYAIFSVPFENGEWEVRILKTYRLAANEIDDPFARWFTFARSPMTFGSWEGGDQYRKEILENFSLKFTSEEFRNAYQNDPEIQQLIKRARL